MIEELFADPVTGVVAGLLGAAIAKAFDWMASRDRSHTTRLQAQRDDLTSGEKAFRQQLLDAYERCEEEHRQTKEELMRSQQQLREAIQRITRLEARLSHGGVDEHDLP